MALIRVTPVQHRKSLLRFIRQPRTLYPPDSLWVSPLDWERLRFFRQKKNPFFSFAKIELFIARDERGRDLGRIAAIENPRFNEFQKKKVGFFGFFDSIDDPEVSRALFDAVEGWLRDRGLTVVQGPFNPSSNHECGLLVSGFDRPPRILMPYNHDYYPRLVEDAGYRGIQDLVGYEYEVDGIAPPRLIRAIEHLRERSAFTIRKVNLKRFEEEVERLKIIYNEAWSQNYGFVPFTDEEIGWMALELRSFVTPEMCQFAEVKGEIAGMMLALPDVNQALKPLRGRLFPTGWWKLLRGLRRINALRAVLLGALPQYRNLGIDYAFYYEGLKLALTHGIREIELSWVLDHNVHVLRPLNRLGARETKRYRLYEKTLS